MKILSILLSSLFLISCGKKKSSSTSYNDYQELTHGTNIQTMNQNMELSSNTPNAIGTLLSLRDINIYSSEISACTWFLVSKNVALTNSHCIPDHLKHSNSDCANFVMGTFKNDSGETIHRTCKKIVTASQIDAEKTIKIADFAVIQLDTPVEDTTPLKVSKEGIQVDDIITMHTMNHQMNNSTITSEYLEHRCVVKSSDLFVNIDSSSAQTFAAFQDENSTSRCKLISGNSGSPALNQAGEVIGIGHAGFKPGAEMNLNISSNLKNSVTQNIAIITNLRCAKLIYDKDPHYSARCQNNLPSNNSRTKNFELMAQESLKNEMNRITSTLPTFFEYTTNSKNMGTYTLINFEPKCVRPLDSWSKRDLDSIQERGILIKSKSINTYLMSFKMDTVIDINYYGNLKVGFSASPTTGTTIQLNNLENLESETVKMTKFTQVFGKVYKLKSELKICSDSSDAN